MQLGLSSKSPGQVGKHGHVAEVQLDLSIDSICMYFVNRLALLAFPRLALSKKFHGGCYIRRIWRFRLVQSVVGLGSRGEKGRLSQGYSSGDGKYGLL